MFTGFIVFLKIYIILTSAEILAICICYGQNQIDILYIFRLTVGESHISSLKPTFSFMFLQNHCSMFI